MTHAELSKEIKDRMNGKKGQDVRIHSVRHEDMMNIAAALFALTSLYRNSGCEDPFKSYDATRVLINIIEEYNLDKDEIKAHPISQSIQ